MSLLDRVRAWWNKDTLTRADEEVRMTAGERDLAEEEFEGRKADVGICHRVSVSILRHRAARRTARAEVAEVRRAAFDPLDERPRTTSWRLAAAEAGAYSRARNPSLPPPTPTSRTRSGS